MVRNHLLTFLGKLSEQILFVTCQLQLSSWVTWCTASSLIASDVIQALASYLSISLSLIAAGGILVFWLGIEPAPPVLGVWSLNHWTTREVPEIKSCLILARKAVINLDTILKSRDTTLLTNFCIVKAMVFPVVMYQCESWIIKETDHRRIDAFELWCCGRLLRVPWTARRSNQSFVKEISPEYSLEGPMLKLKLQYFGHLMWRTDPF